MGWRPLAALVAASAIVAAGPKPADLVLHVPQHTDGELYYMVSVGFPDSAMPAWRSVLSEQQRWEIVHYLRVLASGNP